MATKVKSQTRILFREEATDNLPLATIKGNFQMIAHWDQTTFKNLFLWILIWLADFPHFITTKVIPAISAGWLPQWSRDAIFQLFCFKADLLSSNVRPSNVYENLEEHQTLIQSSFWILLPNINRAGLIQFMPTYKTYKTFRHRWVSPLSLLP